MYDQLYYQALKHDKMKILKLSTKNFDKCMTLFEEPKVKLQFYVRQIFSII